MAIYQDINLSFDRHPITGDVVTATDVEAIKKSIRNLIQLNVFDVPFDPETGVNIRSHLFENFSPIMTELIQSKIREMITEKEIRVQIEKIIIFANDARNSLEVTIQFSIKDLNKLEEVTIFVERTR